MEALFAVVAVFVLFELVEHVLLPIAAVIASRKRRATTGAEGMVGKVGRVLSWTGSEGRVQVDGEIWRAESRDRVAADDEVIVRAVRGLRLEVASVRSDSSS